ncbi:MAG: hypothetical protein WC473_02995 [Patescibacteria group bacterium]|jgi:hypothetical protein
MDKFERMVLAVASARHEDWRKQYRAAKGNEPRMKKTKDPAFLARGIAEVDIASLLYEELPTDWQAENKAAAEVAVDSVLAAIDQDVALDDDFIEAVSAIQHKKWLERNGAWAPDSQKVPYDELSEAEKEKDRFFVRQAIEAL